MSYYFHNLFQVILLVKQTFVMLLLMPLSTIFQLYRAVSFIGGGNRIDTDCIGSCKSSYHTITTTTGPYLFHVVWLI